MYFTICYSPHNSLMPHLTRLKMSVTSPASRTGFLYLSHNTSLLWGCPLYCRMFSSIPPLGMPLEASNSPCTNSHDSQPFPIIFCKIKLPLVENPCSRDTCATIHAWASLVVQMVKNLPPVQRFCVWSLDGEDPLVKGMAIHSSILTWRIPRTEPGGLHPWGHKESDTAGQLTLSILSLS